MFWIFMVLVGLATALLKLGAFMMLFKLLILAAQVAAVVAVLGALVWLFKRLRPRSVR